MATVRRLAGIRRLVETESVENDNDANMGTNVARVKREFYIVTLLGGFKCFGTLQYVPISVK